MIRRIPWGLSTLLFASCIAELDTSRETPARGTFGEIVYREACQRVAYTAQLDEQAAGKRATVDVTGHAFGEICTANKPVPMNAPIKLKALQGQRSPIITAVDAILPKDFLSSLESFLIAIQPLNDDGTMTETMSKTGQLLGQLKADGDLTAALARLQGREGYRPSGASDLVRVIMSYPKINEFMAQSLDVLLDSKGAPTPELAALFKALSLTMTSAQADPHPDSSQRTLQLALDLLMSSSNAFGNGRPRLITARDWRGFALPNSGIAAPFVDKNSDGLPDIESHGHFVGGDGKPLPFGTPFPRPGLDSATRDPSGRLLDQGKLVYRTIDLDTTLLNGLLHDAAALSDPAKDNVLGLLYGATNLLGPRVEQTRSYLDSKSGVQTQLKYQGFYTDQSPALDLLHAFLQILGDPRASETLLASKTLLTKYEAPATRVLDAMFDVHDRGAKHLKASIPATSNLHDDMAMLIVRVLRALPRTVNGKQVTLLEDVMDALEDPHSKGLAANMAAQNLFKDRFILNQNDFTVSGSWSTPVDRNAPDSDYNRSIMQRMAHLVHDSNGAHFCNKEGASATAFGLSLGYFKECDLFDIPDIGLFFFLAMADVSIVDDKSRPTTRNMASFREHITNSTLHGVILDNWLGDLALESDKTGTGIPGFTRFPTPEAAARSLFIDHNHQSDFMKNSTEPVICTEGDQFAQAHNDSIFAWEVPIPGAPVPGDSFYDAIRPTVNAFARHDECIAWDSNGNCQAVQNAGKIFLDFFSMLHTHWGTPNSKYFGHSYQSSNPKAKRYSSGDGAVTYEPLLAEVLSQSDLVPAVINLSPTLRTMTLDGTNNTGLARPILLKSLSYIFDPITAQGVAYRDGRTTTTKSDGINPGPSATPFYLLADAFAAKRNALSGSSEEDKARAKAWKAATSALIDQTLAVESINGLTRFKNRRFPAMTGLVIDFLRGRLAAHAAAGDKEKWARKTLTEQAAELLGGPVTAALVDLTARLEAHPEGRDSLNQLVSYLLDSSSGEASDTLLSAVGDLLQVFRDDPDLVPIARAVGRALDLNKGPMLAQLKMMHASRLLDPACPGGKIKAGKDCTLVTVLKNVYHARLGKTPANELSEALGEVNRATPGSGDFSPEDYSKVIENIEQFLTDENRGFVKFINIIKNRHYPPTP